jgi:glycosyltransferase involved in cell wall biosynthesis
MDEVWILLDSRGAGGIETHVAELAEGLAESGARPRVLFLRDHGPHPLRDRLAAAGIPQESLPGGFAALARRLRAGRPHLLHTHGYKANLMGRLAARLAGVRVVASFHAGETPRGRVAAWDAADRWSSCLGGRIAVSAPIRARLPWGAALVPNFVAIPPRPPAARPSGIAFVGRFSPEKGPDLFCDLARRLPELSFQAFGDGAMRAACETQAAGRVRFHGAVPSMAGSWDGIGLLAITSRAEGMPLAALEAMAHGVPVAAFALGALPELIADGVDGYLVPPGDLDAMQARLRSWAALGPQERLGMGLRARDSVAARFGRAAGIARMRAAYDGAEMCAASA